MLAAEHCQEFLLTLRFQKMSCWKFIKAESLYITQKLVTTIQRFGFPTSFQNWPDYPREFIRPFTTER
jgi:hypothetical protein